MPRRAQPLPYMGLVNSLSAVPFSRTMVVTSLQFFSSAMKSTSLLRGRLSKYHLLLPARGSFTVTGFLTVALPPDLLLGSRVRMLTSTSEGKSGPASSTSMFTVLMSMPIMSLDLSIRPCPQESS